MTSESIPSIAARVKMLRQHQAWHLGNLLDIRPEQDFIARHLVGSVSIPVVVTGVETPSSSLLEECLPSIFLPPRHEPLAVIGGSSTLAVGVCEHLAARGRVDMFPFSVADRQWHRLPPDLIVSGRSRGHLWRPPPFLERYEHLLPPPAAGPVLDLACGSGRAAVWLAERGYRVTGIDWQPEALQGARRLAASRGVVCDFYAGDLRDTAQIPAEHWSILLMFRYLQRDLLAWFETNLAPAGVAVIQTFRYVPGHQGLPRRRHCLESDELPGYFPGDSFRILAYEENCDPDGRPAAGILVRRNELA